MIPRFYRRLVIRAGRKLAEQLPIIDEEFLPWRQNRTPYRIFLAELLLIRTRSDVVVRVFEELFNSYPDVYALSLADEKQLGHILHPLGLPKRIPYLVKAARSIVDMYEGQIPRDVNELLKIPGLGRYTASAIASFAYAQPIVPGDVNILRFVARLTGLEMGHKTKGTKDLWELTSLLSEKYTRLSAEKLLDFTRSICKPRKPLCGQCPLSGSCAFFKK